ncbi:CYTH and CHAD domain-containing protein [Pilimelia terevasa]|nr:CYTH and CHAD domain-containing protein [Pilimelia terevasa]
MTSHLEIESTFDLPDDAPLPDLAAAVDGASLDRPARHQLRALYFDTPRLRLLAHAVTLRRRTGGTDAGWHLKRPAGRGREEIHAPAGRAARTVPAALRQQVAVLVRDAPLEPVVQISTARTEYPLRAADGTVLALVADDRVTGEVLGAAVVTSHWREIEVELVDGDEEVLDAVAQALEAAGARPARLASKLAHALGDRLPAPPPPGHGAGAEISGYLRAQRDTLLRHEPGVRAGDPDAVHDMRVAVRRLRSTLQTFRPLLDAAAGEPLRAELKWLADLLGEVRDADVQAARLAEAVAALPEDLVVGPVADQLTGYLAEEAAPARAELGRALASPRLYAALDALDALADAPVRAGRKRVRRLVAGALRRADKELESATDSDVPTSSTALPAPAPVRDAHLHHARRLYKKARYAAEVAAPQAPGAARKLIRRLTALQDVLGAHQDAVVTGQLLGRLALRATQDGASSFTCGVLVAEQRLAAAAALRLLPRARERAGAAAARDWLED